MATDNHSSLTERRQGHMAVMEVQFKVAYHHPGALRKDWEGEHQLVYFSFTIAPYTNDGFCVVI